MQEKIAVIGGGAAGFLAAITSAKNGASVTILERKDRVLKKVLATGNGRCNYTNIYADTSNYYGKNSEFTVNILRKFTPNDTIVFFEKLILFTLEGKLSISNSVILLAEKLIIFRLEKLLNLGVF